nr:MAG TPA: hypothetical protein [Caudoviricetes sp.]
MIFFCKSTIVHLFSPRYLLYVITKQNYTIAAIILIYSFLLCKIKMRFTNTCKK